MVRVIMLTLHGVLEGVHDVLPPEENAMGN